MLNNVLLLGIVNGYSTRSAATIADGKEIRCRLGAVGRCRHCDGITTDGGGSESEIWKREGDYDDLKDG